MANPLLKVRVIGTNKVIEVYKHHSGDYVDYEDCTTMYDKKELIFIKSK